MKYGLILTRSDIKGQIEAAVRAESAGFESVWTIEFFNANGLVRLAAIAAATKRVKLGTGIAYAFMRTPMLAATGGDGHRRNLRRPHDSGPRQRHQDDERKLVFDAVQRSARAADERRDRPDPRRVRRAERRRAHVRRPVLSR